MSNYALDTMFTVPESEIAPFQNLQCLLLAGESIPLLKDGKKIGFGRSCTVYEHLSVGKLFPRYGIKMRLSFLLEKPLGEEVVDLRPVSYTWRVEGIVKFRLLSHFEVVTNPDRPHKF